MNKIKKVSLTLVCIVLLIGLTISTYALNYTNGVYTEDYVVGGDALTRAGYANKITNESYMGINLHYVKPRAGFIDPYSKLRFQIQTWSPGPDPTDFDFYTINENDEVTYIPLKAEVHAAGTYLSAWAAGNSSVSADFACTVYFN